MKVLIAASEAVPFAKTGGLADMTGSLLKELIRGRVDARLIMPLYRQIKQRFNLHDTGCRIQVAFGGRQYFSQVFSYGKQVFFIECDNFFDRQELYGTSIGDYKDNAERFIFFSKAVFETLKAVDFKPDVIHSNDWQTGLIPLYMKTLYKSDCKQTASLFTIHNLGYQGLFPSSVMPLTGLGLEWFNPEGIEFYGRVNFLKAGIVSASAVNTVSGTYAQEILTPEHGFGLDGLLRKHSSKLYGILNGIDTGQWNPKKDSFIAKCYDRNTLQGKAECRAALIKEMDLRKAKGPLLSFIGRLSSQKGIDILIDALEGIVRDGMNIIILGRGQDKFERQLQASAKKHPGQVLLHTGFDDALAHRIYAGSDIFLMPSMYEPCGLSQMIAMRYGTVPLVRQTGGLADTVEDYNHLEDSGTGFLFTDYTSSGLRECLMRALCVYMDASKWKRLLREGMKRDFSWKSSMGEYIALYESIIKKVKR